MVPWELVSELLIFQALFLALIYYLSCKHCADMKLFNPLVRS